jgi:D-alanyl-D-alanine endopeptidase (penicillin-binding protein 7)
VPRFSGISRVLRVSCSVLALAVAGGYAQATTVKKAPTQARKAAPKPAAITAAVGAKAAHKPIQHVAMRKSVPLRHGRRMAAVPPEVFNPNVLDVQSTAALVVNLDSGEVIYDKNTSAVAPIASITKLMTAMVVLDAKLPLEETIAVTEEDLDYLKYTGSRLHVGMSLTRDEMLRLALMSSENRAAAALGRAYPGGLPAFVREMNLKALSLDMRSTSFVDSTGLSSSNVSTAQDLAKMVQAAYQYPMIRQYSTGNGYMLQTQNGRAMQFGTSNSLVVSPDWQINLQKTGYIRESGRCVVMHSTIANSPIVIVLLDSWGRLSRVGDANRIKRWIEYHSGRTIG